MVSFRLCFAVVLEGGGLLVLSGHSPPTDPAVRTDSDKL